MAYEGDHISPSDHYNWQGTPFPLRPAQQPANRTRRKRQTASSSTATPGRKDEPEQGILVIVETIQVLIKYLTGSARSPFRSPRDNYIVIVRFVNAVASDPNDKKNTTTTDDRSWSEMVEIILQRMWTEYGIENVFLMAPCIDAMQSDADIGNSTIGDMVATYYPFALGSVNASTTAADPDNGAMLTAEQFGRCRWTTIDRIEYTMRTLRRLDNMHGFPFPVSIFERYPTAWPVVRMSSVLAQSYFNRAARSAAGFAGFDGLVLGNMAERLNFRTVVVAPSGDSDYGWVDANGTYYGEWK